jgi:hypothetical protein
MIDMAWLPSAAEDLEEALSPDFHERRQAVLELREAGVASGTIEALYPFEPFPHAEVVQQLVRVPNFVSKARPSFAVLNVESALPSQLRAQYARSLGIVYSMSGTKTYTAPSAAPAAAQVAQRLVRESPTPLLVLPQPKLPGASGVLVKSQQETVGEALLRLPLLLHLCARYPFPEYSDWQSVKVSAFSEHMVNARQHVANVVSLVNETRRWIKAESH